MRRINRVFFIVAIAVMAAAGVSHAYVRGGGWWGVGERYGKTYDPKTVATIKGKVESVERFTPLKGMSEGVHLMVRTDSGTIDVHLGPSWFVDNQQMKFGANDTVEVRGSTVTFDGKPAMIAAEVKKNGQTLTLRDDKGVPVWAGKGRRQAP
jgi:hypothetical protein